MLQNVSKSIEVQDEKRKDFEAEIKAFDAQTKRLSVVQGGMTEEQISDIVMGTIHGAITSGDLVSAMPERSNYDNIPEIEPQEVSDVEAQNNPTANTGIAPV
jgi:hypothetical protein